MMLSLLVSILLIYFVFFQETNKYTYKYSVISKGAVEKTISTTGELFVKEELVNSKVSAFVSVIYVKINQHVRKGQLLFSLRSEGLDLQIKRLKSSIESMKLKVEMAEKKYEAKKNMYMENLISKDGLRGSEIAYKQVLIQQKNTRLNYSIALKKRRNTRVYSSVRGVVLSIKVKEDQPVGVNTNLMKLAVNMKKMTLAIRIDESDIGYIKDKQRVVFTVSAFPDLSFKGIIQQVQMNPQKIAGLVTYKSIVSCDNSSLKLKPGMTATAIVSVGAKKNVLRVPNQSFIVSPNEVINTDEFNIIWIKSGLNPSGFPKKIKVTPGLRGDLFTEIKKLNESEIKLGDKVLIRAIIEDE